MFGHVSFLFNKIVFFHFQFFLDEDMCDEKYWEENVLLLKVGNFDHFTQVYRDS